MRSLFIQEARATLFAVSGGDALIVRDRDFFLPVLYSW
jgi:hypothetical protein